MLSEQPQTFVMKEGVVIQYHRGWLNFFSGDEKNLKFEPVEPLWVGVKTTPAELAGVDMMARAAAHPYGYTATLFDDSNDCRKYRVTSRVRVSHG